MSDSTKKRLAIDLDEIERQLRQTAPGASRTTGAGADRQAYPDPGPQTSAQAAPRPEAPKQDPLAELARITGQEDPYRAILSGDRAGVQPTRRDPDLDAVFAREPVMRESLAHESLTHAPDDQAWAATQGDAAAPPVTESAPDPLPDWRSQWRREAGGEDDSAWRGEPGHGDNSTTSPTTSPITPSRQTGQPAAAPASPYDDDALFAHPAEAPGAHPRPGAHGYAPFPQEAPPAPPRPGIDHAAFEAALHQQDLRQHGSPPHGQHPEGYHADGFDAYDGSGYHDDYPDHHDDIGSLHRHKPARKSRKGALTVGAVLGMAVIGVASALVFIGGSTGPEGGEPPLITADESAIRVEPTNPGGLDIPDQDRQIFEQTTEGETNVVDREEQPVDLDEVARQTPRVVLPPPAASQNRGGPDAIAQVIAGDFDASANAFEAADPSPAVAELGEPRRVSTVVVRPDGSIIDGNGEIRTARPAAERTAPEAIASAPEPASTASVDPSGNPVSDAPGSELSSATNEPAAAEAEQASTPEPASTASVERADPAPQAEQTPPAQAQAQAPAPTPGPMPLTGATQIAPQAQQNTAPQQVASAPATQSAPAPAASGDYVVQLGISSSETGAEQAFGQFRQRYSGIISDSAPIIRRAEVNGSTIYRVRVGPYSLSDANSVCDRIKNSGGDCFVARN